VKRSFGELKEKRGRRDCSKRSKGEIPREGRTMHPKANECTNNEEEGCTTKKGTTVLF
jgi:hypothetical protein